MGFQVIKREVRMKRKAFTLFLFLSMMMSMVAASGCSTAYKVKPMAFKMPSAYHNVVSIGNAEVAAIAFTEKTEAQEAFGFDILGAGMLPVQVVFDNQGPHSLEIDSSQTFLEDQTGNLWPILSSQIAYARATKYSQSKSMVKEGAFHGLWGATAGGIVGAAIGIITGDNIGSAMGKGAAVGAAAGATVGSAKGYDDTGARREIINDLREKSLQNVPIGSQSIARGFLFFPGEAGSARQLRLQLREIETGNVYVSNFIF
jgi:outer membrane lipoprotein SlyB